jgi:hypothetical protein
MSVKSFQDRLRIVNSNLVGLSNRLENTSQFHPMVRNNWGTEDKVRGLLGKYYTPIYPTNPSFPDVLLFNYADLYSNPLEYLLVKDKDQDILLVGQAAGDNQGTNLIFDYSVETYPMGGYDESSTWVSTHTQTSLILEFDQPGWASPGYNLASNGSLNYFGGAPGTFGDTAIPWIADNLSRYFGTSDNAVPIARIGGPIPSEIAAAIDQGLPVSGAPVEGILRRSQDRIFADHTTEFYLPSNNALVRQAAGDGLTIESTYVQYVDSVPALEEVIASPQVTEQLIPNAYYLQLELQNTTDVLLAEGRFAQSLTLDYNVPWFDVTSTVNRATEDNKKRFYEEFAQTLNSLIVNEDLEDVKAALVEYKDIFVLHRDRDVLKEDAIDLSTIPFYNKIIIPAVGSEGRDDGLSGLEQRALVGNPNTIDFLQTQAIRALRPSLTEPTVSHAIGFTANIRKINNPSDSTDATYTTTTNTPYKIVYDVEDAFGDILQDIPVNHTDEISNDKPINNAIALHNRPPAGAEITSLDGLNTEIIPPIELDPSIVDDEIAFMSFADDVTRNYEETLAGEFCHTETLLFVVKKFRVMETTETLVQTFYFTNLFNEKEIVYYDSQIKTQQKYRYEIHRVVFVFGTEYEYDTAGFSGFSLRNQPWQPPEQSAPTGPTATQGQGQFSNLSAGTAGTPVPGQFGNLSAGTAGIPGAGQFSNLSAGTVRTGQSSTPNLHYTGPSTGPTLPAPAAPYSQHGTPTAGIPGAGQFSNLSAGTVSGLTPPGPTSPGTNITPYSRFVASLPINHAPSLKAILVPYVIGGITIATQDKPPVSPNLSFYPFKGINNRVKILLQSSTGIQTEKPIALRAEDRAFFEDEYLAQTGVEKAFAQITDLQFRSDDPVDLYQLFRLRTAPTSYEDFENFNVIDPPYGRAGSATDTIQPNRKYYYCARAVDIHGNISNPTHIFEIEMVDNGGQIFLRQSIFMFESIQPQYTKSGRRFIYIEPSLQQLALEPNANIGTPNINNPPNSSILGADGVDSVWNNTYKIRVTSKKTNRKLDLNVTFTNTGIVNPSE